METKIVCVSLRTAFSKDESCPVPAVLCNVEKEGSGKERDGKGGEGKGSKDVT